MAMRSKAENPLMTIKATGSWQFGFTSSVQLDNLEATEERSGSVESASSGIDMAVAALVSCTCATLSVVAKEMDFHHNGVDFAGQADFSIGNLAGDAPVSKFEAVQAIVTVRTDENEERFNDLTSEVQRRCRVYGVLADAGLKPDIEWRRADASR